MDAGRSFHLVHVWDDTITHAVVPVVDVEASGIFTPEWTARMAALSRKNASTRSRASASEGLPEATVRLGSRCPRAAR